MMLVPGAEKTNNMKYCSCSQAALICLEAEDIPETMKTIIKYRRSDRLVLEKEVGRMGSITNEISEKAGFEVSF